MSSAPLEVLLKGRTRIHLYARDAFIPGLIRTRCGKLGLPATVEHGTSRCRACQKTDGKDKTSGTDAR